MIMRHIVCKARLSKLDLFCHKKLKQGGNLISVFNYLTVESKKNTTFGRIHRNQTKGKREITKEIPIRDTENFCCHENGQVLGKGVW